MYTQIIPTLRKAEAIKNVLANRTNKQLQPQWMNQPSSQVEQTALKALENTYQCWHQGNADRWVGSFAVHALKMSPLYCPQVKLDVAHKFWIWLTNFPHNLLPLRIDLGVKFSSYSADTRLVEAAKLIKKAKTMEAIR
ncbi:MAG TPA: hypothetical protein VK203_22885 [Nostocaceae cyanobacterium]|nr:hypothetical protein [Nostocaceae cyanobacterium]